MKFILIFLFLLPMRVIAADFYIAQSAAGSGNGSSCANAHALSGLTWAGGDINDGDTLHLCGTFTSTLTIGDSGGSGTEYTVYFEEDAKFSKSAWSSAAINTNGKSYIIIDGGTNGIIENTDNGTAGTYGSQIKTDAMTMGGSSNIELKNLTIQNLYVRTGADDFSTGASGGSFIYASTFGNNLLIHDCTFSWAYRDLTFNYNSNVSNWKIYNNTFTHGCTGIWIAPTNVSTLTGLHIYNNTMDHGDDWSFNDNNDRWHAEYFHPYTDSGGFLDDVYVYNNTFGPESPMKLSSSATTAWIFDEADGDNHQYYNNLFISGSGFGATDGLLTRSSRSVGVGTKILNNTFIQLGSQGGNAINLSYGGDASLLIKNNIVQNTTYGIYAPSGLSLTANSQIDYNVFYNVSTWGNGSNWTTWTGNGYDPNSSNGSEPSLDANYVPTSDDTIAKDQGVDLSVYFTNDRDGNTRTGTWDIGAYEYGEAETPAPANAIQGVTIN